MSFFNKYFVLMIALILTLSACGGAAAPTQSGGEEHNNDEPTMESTMEHMEDGAGNEEHEHDGETTFVPNNGAVIKIVAPEDGAEIAVGTDIVVKVETENFPLGEDGNHWHIFVDGQVRGMITGRDFDEVVRGLEPGKHEISAHLSIKTHEELEEGDSISIVIVE